MAVDPVHIGTGGYRLGRVDNAIAREPGTNLPKIPGSSLHGAIRSSAALAYGKPRAAGQKPIGNPKTCPIVYTFGSGDGTEGGFQSGIVSIFDARLVFFPIASLDGPVWVTTSTLLREAGFTGDISEPTSPEKALTTFNPVSTNVNLGWLMLEREERIISTLSWQPFGQTGDKTVTELNHILSRLVIVHDSLFAHVVEAGLEVRTSVSINPETGAASDGALFTYEALPRTTVLAFDIILDDFKALNPGPQNPFEPPIKKKFKFDSDVAKAKEGQGKDNAGEPLPIPWEGPMDVVNTGLDMLEYLGVGGMGTRGFGRIRKLLSFTDAKKEEAVAK